MPTPLVGNVFPVAEEWLGIGSEAAGGIAVAALPTATIPVEKIDPENKYTMLDDNSVRGMMANLFSVTGGTQSAQVDFSGNVYMDTIGHVLLNLMGDYSATGSSPTNATTLTAQANAGATTCSVALGTGYSIGQAVQIGSGVTAEVVVLTTVSGTTLTFAGNPLRFTHASAQTVATVVAPFTHKFSLLNSAPGQPITHTLSHFTGLTGAKGVAVYPYWCCSGCSFDMSVEKLLTHQTKGISYIRQVGSGTYTNSFSSEPVYPNWRFAVGIGGPATGGTQVNDVSVASLDITRQLTARFTANGQQNPYNISRNALAVEGKFTEIAQNENPLLELLNNTQPQIQLLATNGLTGASTRSITFDMQVAAYETVKESDNEVVMYDSTFKAVVNPTNAGGSGGQSPLMITLVNAVPTY